MFLHLDLDCFFVSAHRTIDNTLLNIPVAVIGKNDSNIFFSSNKKNIAKESNENYLKKIITTSSYEARKLGIMPTMNVKEALKIYPKLKIIEPNYILYKNFSLKLKKLLEKEVPLIEQFSIDEFFADVTGYKNENNIEDFAYYLKEKIKSDLDLPISIGIANSKYISKLLTNRAKPFGVKYIRDEEMDTFLSNIPIEEFPSVGNVLKDKLNKHGITTLKDIKSNKDYLYSLKKTGVNLFNRVSGINDNKLIANQEKKSIGLGRSFNIIYDRDEILRRIMIICRHICFLTNHSKLNPLTYNINFKYETGIRINKSITVNRIFNEFDFKNKIKNTFYSIDKHPTYGIKYININVSNFANKKNSIYDMFEHENDLKKRKLENKLQKIRTKFGIDIIKTASEL